MNKPKKGIAIQKTLPTMKVKVEIGQANQPDFAFTESFSIGRDDTCEIQIQDQSVSRMHTEVYFREGRWWVRDLGSANGTYVDGKKIEGFPWTRLIRIELGLEGPVLSLDVEGMPNENATEAKQHSSVTKYIKQYFGGVTREDAGKHTMFVRQAFKRVQKKQKKKYYLIIAVVAFLLFISGGYAIYQHKKFEEQKELTIDLFYRMKSLELQLTQFKNKLIETQDTQNLKVVKDFEDQLTEMKNDYEQSLDDLGVYGKNMNEKERLILEISRIFGECELNMPKGFVREVKKYIKYWKSSNRLENAIKRANENNYPVHVSKKMLDHGLPPQFFYLALQESDFDPESFGIKTRWGIAKGIWHFIPGTARQYGLKTGPLVKFRKYDPLDERYNFEKATEAAAKYLRYIYNTKAQASGLLVMASYNWGEPRVIKLWNEMKEDPRERNFWCLFGKYKKRIPKQTWNYVFYIISAAIIGENPREFGFSFDNPLAHAEEVLE